MAFRAGGAAGKTPAGRMADRHDAQAGEAERLELVLVGAEQFDHVRRFAPAGVQRHPLRSQGCRLIGKEADGDREHSLVTKFDQADPASRQDHGLRRWFVAPPGGRHEIELRIACRERLGFLRIRPGEQDLMGTTGLLQLRGHAFKRLAGGLDLDRVVPNLSRLLIAQNTGDSDAESADFDDAKPRRDIGVEPEQADVRAQEWRRLVAHGSDGGHQFLGREPQVIGTEPDGRVAHRPQPVGDRLEFHLGLPAEASDLAPEIHCQERPAGRVHRP